MTDQISFQDGDALLMVDIQKDFCPGGALAVENGDLILAAANAWLAQADQQNVPVYASRDWHPEGHPSFADQGGDWPPHCLQDSDGARFHPDLVLPQDTVVVTKGVRFDQDQTSVFDHTGLAVHLKNEGIRRLFVGGLALDVCVADSVMDALAAGFEVVLITEATRPVDGSKVDEVVNRMQSAGATFTSKAALAELMAGRAASDPDVCVKAPEWAEHQRLQDDDMPCDDGRSGKI
jgi:nicotinamidase/pyrazinamidase